MLYNRLQSCFCLYVYPNMANVWFVARLAKPLATGILKQEVRLCVSATGSAAKNPSPNVIPSTKQNRKDKSSQISAAIQIYLKNAKNYEKKLLDHQDAYELGKVHLARIMGEDPETFTQEKVDEAIAYLMPSGLTSPRAHPKLKPYKDIFPSKKSLQCDLQGRPVHHMFYTGKPNYYALMLDAALKLEELKREEDTMIRKGHLEPPSDTPKVRLMSSDWISLEEVQEKTMENVTELDYSAWKMLMERIVKHPYSHKASDFIMQFRKVIYQQKSETNLPKPQADPLSQRNFVEAYGQRKSSIGRLTMYMPGTGKFTVNKSTLLEVFSDIGTREQIMFPLQLSNMLGRVDVEADVRNGGLPSQAGALRLALARAIACFVDEDNRERLRLAGLLTQDMRFSERKRPGQPGARRKFIWKAR